MSPATAVTRIAAGACGGGHGQGSPERDAHRSDQHPCAPDPRGEGSERGEENERRSDDGRNENGPWRHEDRDQRKRGADGEAGGRGERSLERLRGGRLRVPEFVPRVGAERVLRHELLGHLGRERGFEAAGHVDSSQLRPLGRLVGGELGPLALEIGALRVGLRADRDVFAGRHRHRAGHEPRHRRDEDRRRRRPRRGDADDEARGRDEAVVRAEDRRAEPADPLGAMEFRVTPHLMLSISASRRSKFCSLAATA
jgi:hypothetical protein